MGDDRASLPSASRNGGVSPVFCPLTSTLLPTAPRVLTLMCGHVAQLDEFWGWADSQVEINELGIMNGKLQSTSHWALLLGGVRSQQRGADDWKQSHLLLLWHCKSKKSFVALQPQLLPFPVEAPILLPARAVHTLRLQPRVCLGYRRQCRWSQSLLCASPQICMPQHRASGLEAMRSY